MTVDYFKPARHDRPPRDFDRWELRIEWGATVARVAERYRRANR